jgi:hypothetical protein
MQVIPLNKGKIFRKKVVTYFAAAKGRPAGRPIPMYGDAAELCNLLPGAP